MATIDLGRIGGPLVIPNCVQVKIEWTAPNGQPAFNVLHGAIAGGFAATVAVANALRTALGSGTEWTALAAYLSNGCALAAIHLLDLRTPSLAEVQSSNGIAAGTSVSDALPPSTAACVTLRTAQAGVAFRGRMYVPCWALNAGDSGGIMATAAKDALQAWADDIPVALATSGITLAIGHPARAAYTGSTGTAHAARSANTVPVTSLVVRNALWDTQRRRGGPS